MSLYCYPHLKYNYRHVEFKGLVINNGEGGGLQLGKSQVRNFLRSPQDRVKPFAPPLLKGGNFLRPPPPHYYG